MSLISADELPSRPSPAAAGARLGELYTEHSRVVYGICRMLLRDPEEAEDTTQQVFLAAYKNLLTGTEVRDPAAWLGTIARNACRRRAIARMREPLAVEGEITLISPAADEQAEGRERAAALYAELAALPEKQREAVVLRDVYGLRYDEVAVALGTSRPAVEALLFRGRRRLQHRLRPRSAAGVLVVPLAVHESIAYAVPGFASTAVPAGAVATAAGIPILAKLAAAGAAVSVAGSAGFAAERAVHDSPARPADIPVVAVAPVTAPPAGEPMLAASLLPLPRRSREVGDESGLTGEQADDHDSERTEADTDEDDDDRAAGDREADDAEDADGGEVELDEHAEQDGDDHEDDADEDEEDDEDEDEDLGGEES